MHKSVKLSKYKNISHSFFNKKGGVSLGIYKSLNCGLGSKDKKNNVLSNLKKVKKKIGCKNKNLILLKQIHSSKIYYIKSKPKNKLIGDACLTKTEGLAIGILTADCAPILAYDEKNKIVGAAHAGWKGALNNIVLNLAKAFIKKGSEKKNLIFVIGPCISQNNYEVKNDFVRKFVSKDKLNLIFFKTRKKKIYFDLSRFIQNQLNKFCVNRVDVIKKDTFVRKNNFFSARYAAKKKHADFGRNISVIMIK